MRRSPKLQCKPGRPALGSSRPRLRTPASVGHPSQSSTGRDRGGCCWAVVRRLRDDELAVTLVALGGYYAVRADLRRRVQVLESLRGGVEQGRPWFGPMIEALFGMVAWLRGGVGAAG